jgi:hypothetical protein
MEVYDAELFGIIGILPSAEKKYADKSSHSNGTRHRGSSRRVRTGCGATGCFAEGCPKPEHWEIFESELCGEHVPGQTYVV